MLLLMVKFSLICYFSTAYFCVRYYTRQWGSSNKWDLARVLPRITLNQRTQIMFQRNHLSSWNLELEKYVQHIEIITFFLFVQKHVCVFPGWFCARLKDPWYVSYPQVVWALMRWSSYKETFKSPRSIKHHSGESPTQGIMRSTGLIPSGKGLFTWTGSWKVRNSPDV